MASIQAVRDGEFEREVLQSELPVLVDFWADWCGPCHRVAPEVEAVGLELAGRMRVLKLNVDENPRTANRYQVRSIPTLILFSAGAEQTRVVGALPRTTIRSEVEPYLGVQTPASAEAPAGS
jgi:thioredoxin 1